MPWVFNAFTGNLDWSEDTAGNTAIINAVDSPCIITGGEVTTGTNAGTFKVAAITEAYVRATASDTGILTSVTLAEQDNQAITAADTIYYVIFTYGDPCTITTSESAPNNQNAIVIGKVMKDSSDNVHYISGGLRLGNAAFKTHQRARTLRAVELQSGSAIAYSGTNNFTMGTGIVYAGLNRISLASYDSAVTTFTPVYTGFVEGNELTGTDIAFVDGGAGEDTITRTAADFLTNGYVAGDVLTVAGSASNNGSYDIVSVIADTINVATGSLVAEAAGASVTLTIEKKKIDFEHYDNAGALGEIGNNRYGVHYVYKHIDDDHVYVRYGTDSYTLAEAEAYAVEPPSIPTHLSDFGCLIGAIIAPKAGGSFTKIVMVTSQFFSGTEAANHDNLGNLDYASSGHTGFAASGTNSDITSMEGLNNDGIPLAKVANALSDAATTLTAATELTIATGAITVTQALHRIDTEADAASDDLATINGGADGRVIIVRAENAARTVVLKDGTGNLELNGSDITLDDTDLMVMLVYDGTLSKWVLTGGGGGTVATDTIWDAAGDLVQGTGADTAAKLTKGTALALLKMNSAGTAVEWGTAGQIAFPATAVPSADANTLDDYEEGTWTPALEGSVTAGNTTYTVQAGWYEKIGRQVNIRGSVIVNLQGTLDGVVFLVGLPFTTNTTADSQGSINIGQASSLAITATESLTALINSNSTKATLKIWNNAEGTINFDDAELTDGAKFRFAGQYMI